jgi:hypothetical protein
MFTYHLIRNSEHICRNDGLEIPPFDGEPNYEQYKIWIAAGNSPLPANPMLPAGIWEKIKQKRDKLRFEGGVKVGANWYKSTQIAIGEYNALLLLYGTLPDTTVLRAAWRTMNGALIDMTPALCRAILMAGVAQVAAIDDVSQAHKAAMEANATPEIYDYSTGWPITYL